jgi:surfactin synthase thioesterase subunit
MRLLCAPYAGGAASLFQAWPHGLPSDVEIRAVQLPARQERLREPPLTRISRVVDHVRSALDALSPLPTVLFGHSFGSIVAFELARSLHAAGSPPVSVVVGARRAPHLPRVHADIHHLSDREFSEALHRHYGTPLSVLSDSDLMSLALPSLRADFEVLETYHCAEGAPLTIPFTVLRGRRDVSVPGPDAAAWGHVAETIVHKEIDAGHFFIDTHRPWVLTCVAEVLAAARRETHTNASEGN